MKTAHQWSQEILRSIQGGALLGLLPDQQVKWVEALVDKIQMDVLAGGPGRSGS